MRTRRNAVAAAVGLAVILTAAVGVTGCVQSAPAVIPTSEPSSMPVFSSNAAALAAAKKAFTGYVSASDSIGAAGGSDPELIAKWVTPDRLKAEEEVFNSFAKTGNRLTGRSQLSNFKLQQISQSSGGRIALNIYVCDDVSGSRLVNAAGADITPSGRQGVVPFQVSMKNAFAHSKRLLVDGSNPWSGTDFCS